MVTLVEQKIEVRKMMEEVVEKRSKLRERAKNWACLILTASGGFLPEQ
jgi:hypothetical protein